MTVLCGRPMTNFKIKRGGLTCDVAKVKSSKSDINVVWIN